MKTQFRDLSCENFEKLMSTVGFWDMKCLYSLERLHRINLFGTCSQESSFYLMEMKSHARHQTTIFVIKVEYSD